MTKVYLTIMGLLIAALLGLGWFGKTQYDSARGLQTENKALVDAAEQAQRRAKADRKVLVARQAEIASKQRELAEAHEALHNSLQRNKAWSDTDVPTDVQKALQGRSDGPDSGSTGLRNPD